MGEEEEVKYKDVVAGTEEEEEEGACGAMRESDGYGLKKLQEKEMYLEFEETWLSLGRRKATESCGNFLERALAAGLSLRSV